MSTCTICGGALDGGFVELTAELIRKPPPGGEVRLARFRDVDRRCERGTARLRFQLPDAACNGGGLPLVTRVRLRLCLDTCMSQEGGIDPSVVISAAQRIVRCAKVNSAIDSALAKAVRHSRGAA